MSDHTSRSWMQLLLSPSEEYGNVLKAGSQVRSSIALLGFSVCEERGCQFGNLHDDRKHAMLHETLDPQQQFLVQGTCLCVHNTICCKYLHAQLVGSCQCLGYQNVFHNGTFQRVPHASVCVALFTSLTFPAQLRLRLTLGPFSSVKTRRWPCSVGVWYPEARHAQKQNLSQRRW